MGTWYDYAIIGGEVLVWWVDGNGDLVRRHLPVEHAQSFVAMLDRHDVAVQAALRDGVVS